MFRGNSCGCGCGCCCEQSCCCQPSCCCNGCGGCDSCDNGHENGGEDEAPAAPAEAGASVKPLPPRPMSDPNAQIGQQREVVRTSFLR
jgi:hypothetical protein